MILSGTKAVLDGLYAIRCGLQASVVGFEEKVVRDRLRSRWFCRWSEIFQSVMLRYFLDDW